MMEIGNGVLTAEEERAHFGLWAISKSPMLLGTDLTKISSSSLATITNQGVIAINQDPLGIAATTFQPSTAAAPVSGQLYPYWSGRITNGYVIGLVAVNGASTLSVSFADVPGLGAGTFSWTELYTGVSGTGTGVSATLQTHDMAIFKVSGGSGGGGVTSTKTSSSTVVPTKTSSVGSTTATALPTGDNGGSVAEWGQCGGIGYVGSTVCVSPFTCHVLNAYYSQCY